MRYPVFLSLVLFASPALAGVVFEIETLDHDYSPARTERTRVLADGLLLKIENSEGQRGVSDEMIFRGDRREMLAIDHERRSYMVLDRQFVTNMVGQLQQVTGQMQGMLDSIPAEQRAMFEQMAKQNPTQGQPAQGQPTLRKPTIQVRNTGKQAQVYGYQCVLFVVTRDGRKVRDVWVTNWNNISGSRELVGTFDTMSDFFRELVAAFPMQTEGPVDDSVFATMKEFGGFPVATREYRADGSVETESALRSAQLQSINPAVFQPPSTYQQDSMFGSGGQFGPASARGNYRQAGR